MKLIILLGAPGAGKGSVSQKLVLEHGFKHLSTGNIFRKSVESDKDKLNTGTLFSDDYVNNAVVEELKKCGKEDRVILDGYPRTRVQADFLSKHYFLDKIFLLSNIDDDLIIKRLNNRLLCKKNGHSFNSIFCAPKVSGICDFDSSELFKRPDDEESVARKRLLTYKEHTQPLIEYYRKTGKLEELDATQSIDKMVEQVLSSLEN